MAALGGNGYEPVFGFVDAAGAEGAGAALLLSAADAFISDLLSDFDSGFESAFASGLLSVFEPESLLDEPPLAA